MRFGDACCAVYEFQNITSMCKRYKDASTRNSSEYLLIKMKLKTGQMMWNLFAVVRAMRIMM